MRDFDEDEKMRTVKHLSNVNFAYYFRKARLTRE
jgi:hypothetical protein